MDSDFVILNYKNKSKNETLIHVHLQFDTSFVLKAELKKKNLIQYSMMVCITHVSI
jgi:hypothetical protein